jgi:putative acetyltransferase
MAPEDPMPDELEVRESTERDWGAIELLYPEAFPDEDLLALVRDLLRDASVTTSLIGVLGQRIAGHGIFTKCGVAGSDLGAALLGPLAVSPTRQGRGIGSAIVRDGLRRMEAMGLTQVFVLGDPAYYARLGFLPERLVEPPYDLPAEWDGAWQSQRLGDKAAPCSGRLSVPRQWRQPALWLP